MKPFFALLLISCVLPGDVDAQAIQLPYGRQYPPRPCFDTSEERPTNLGSMYPEDCTRAIEQRRVDRHREAVEAIAKAEAAKRAAQKDYAAAERSKKELADKIKARNAEDAAQGYIRTSFEDFELDGRKMVVEKQRVSIFGWYARFGELNLLFPTNLGSFIANNRHSPDGSIALILDGASRDSRKYFLQCHNPMMPQVPCPVTVLASVGMCVQTTSVAEIEKPCLYVEDAWLKP
jgi:hypothetical protein